MQQLAGICLPPCRRWHRSNTPSFLSRAAASALDCADVRLHADDTAAADFLGPLQFASAGGQRLAYRRILARDGTANAATASPLVLTLGYGEQAGDGGCIEQVEGHEARTA